MNPHTFDAAFSIFAVLCVLAGAAAVIYQTLRDVAARRRRALPPPDPACARRWSVGTSVSGFREIRR